jgi:hypothetical protein
MGYYVRAECQSFRLKKEHFEEAHRLMCALNKLPDENKRGGGGGKRWFSWMPENYDETCLNLADILDCLGFHPQFDELSGDIIDLEYDSKIGQEELFFRAIGHLVDDKSVIYWDGEDGAKWRWVFNGEKMGVQFGTVVYA